MVDPTPKTPQQQVAALAHSASNVSGQTPLEASAIGLELLLRIWGSEHHYLLYGLTPEDSFPATASVLEAAGSLFLIQPGFTLDELLDHLGLSDVQRPRRLKIHLGKILSNNGYSRRQGYRSGERPLLWTNDSVFDLNPA